MSDSLTHRQISRVTPNGNAGPGLRVSASILKELGWKAGMLVRWRAEDGRLVGVPVVLQETR